jgi:hypothetical protein
MEITLKKDCTVRELIEILQQVENQNLSVYFNDSDWDLQPVRYIHEGEHHIRGKALILDCSDM